MSSTGGPSLSISSHSGCHWETPSKSLLWFHFEFGRHYAHIGFSHMSRKGSPAVWCRVSRQLLLSINDLWNYGSKKEIRRNTGWEECINVFLSINDLCALSRITVTEISRIILYSSSETSFSSIHCYSLY